MLMSGEECVSSRVDGAKQRGRKLSQPIRERGCACVDPFSEFNDFLSLLRLEEEFFRNEKNDTQTMISRLRKIFYDHAGWDAELIRGAAEIPCRYEPRFVDSRLLDCGANDSGRSKSTARQSLVRVITVREDDWMNPCAGSIPQIFRQYNEGVRLPDGSFCDIGHVLAGMDASLYPAPVAPLRGPFLALRACVPNVDSNLHCATWLGDMSSSAGEFLYESLRLRRPLAVEEMQAIINLYAQGADMLGNIDSVVIPEIYALNTDCGQRVSEIFQDYYCCNGVGHYFMKRRCSLFCNLVGLKGFDGERFENEVRWTRYMVRQLRNTTAFYVFTRFERIAAYTTALAVWLGCFRKTLEIEVLVKVFLAALKQMVQQEPDQGMGCEDLIREGIR